MYLPLLMYIMVCLLLLVSCAFSIMNTRLMRGEFFLLCPMPLNNFFLINKWMLSIKRALKKIMLLITNMNFRDKELLCPSKLTIQDSPSGVFIAYTKVSSLSLQSLAGGFTAQSQLILRQTKLQYIFILKLYVLIKGYLRVEFYLVLRVGYFVLQNKM